MDKKDYEKIIQAMSEELSERIVSEEQDLAKRARLIDQDIAEIVREVGLQTTKKVLEKSRDRLVLKKTSGTGKRKESDD